MHTIYLLPILIPLVASAPILCTEGNPGSVYVCSKDNFQGQCQYLSMVEYCYGFVDYGPVSIGPDPGGYCITYLDSSCALPIGWLIQDEIVS
jgi:hypothetical protein